MNLAESTIVHRIDAATQREFAALARGVARQSAFVAATAGGQDMSVKIANAGALGWLADADGYRYAPTHPKTGDPWPPIPQAWLDLATEIAGSHPWDCAHLVWYVRGAKLGWHRDKTERDRSRPIFTISLGDEASWAVRLDEHSQITRCTMMSGDCTLLAGSTRSAMHTVESITPAGLFAPSPLSRPGRLAISIRCAG